MMPYLQLSNYKNIIGFIMKTGIQNTKIHIKIIGQIILIGKM